MKQEKKTPEKHLKWHILILSSGLLLLCSGFYLKYKDGQIYFQHQTETVCRAALRETLNLQPAGPTPPLMNLYNLSLTKKSMQKQKI